jgi:hypothetical protein
LGRILFWNFALISIGLILLEAIFGTWFSDEHALYRLNIPRDIRVVKEIPVDYGSEFITYSRDKYGFRGSIDNVSSIDILTVGGSTTDQGTVDDEKTFQAVVKILARQEGVVVSIANAGVNGQSTYGHIENFRSWFAAINNLHAEYILFYVGINDLLKLSAHEEFDSIVTASTEIRVKNFIKQHSTFYQIYKIVKGAFTGAAPIYSMDRRNIADRNSVTISGYLDTTPTPEMHTALDGFKKRLSELSRLTHEIGARPIFVTQRTAMWNRQDGKIYGVANYQADAFEVVRKLLPVGYERLNGIDFYNFEKYVSRAVMSECAKAQAICIDLFAEIEFDLSNDFQDSVHTTASGSERIGEYLFLKLGEAGVLD